MNVPIRTVLFTKLCKYDGEKTSILTVRDFQQISGRAGRKGFDDRGTVVVQAPEHVIENLALEQKAAGDPKKAKKLVKRKPPEKGFLPWTKDTMIRLSEGQPEQLVSRFKVDHAMVLNVLSREGTVNCKGLRAIIGKSHDSEVLKKRHRKQASQLFRSLVDRNIIQLNPLKLNVDLQEDFSLNHGLALFLIDTLGVLDPNEPDYAIDVLTLVESIIENPDLILRRQVDRLKTIKMGEMKQAGMDYDERMAELEKIEHPKPRGEFIYDRFNEFERTHPWVGQDNIRPKSVAREMFEGFMSFHDYIREYGLERVEGLLLRYLSETYKILVQTVPEGARTDEIISVIEYFREMLGEVDSSLVDEWERLKNPELLAAKLALRNEKEAKRLSEQQKNEAALRLEKTRLVAIRNEALRCIRDLSNRSFERLAKMGELDAASLEQKLEEYYQDHESILLDQKARSPHLSQIEQKEDGSYMLVPILRDPDDHGDWCLRFSAKFIETEGGQQLRLSLHYFGDLTQ